MAVAPFDYSLQVQQPFAAAVQGFQIGDAIQARQAEQAKLEAQRQAQMQMQSDLSALASNRNATAADYASMMTRYPQLSEQLKRASEAMSGEQQQSFIRDASPILAALQNQRPDVAEKLLRDSAAAKRASGMEAEAKQDEMLAEMTKLNPDIARSSVALRLAGLPGGDKVIDSISKLGGEDRARAKAPAELRQAEAAAAGAEADATTKGVDAKYADEKGKLSITKLKADIGLTNAQASSAAALAKKYTQETAIAVAQAATGDPARKFDAETKLRNEYTKNIGAALDTREAYRRVKASKDDAVGDLSLIFGYMKMLDPGSVVREGEFANASNAAGVPERIANLYNRVAKGERLTGSQRKAFISQAGDLNAVAERRMNEERERLAPVIKAYGLDARNVYGDKPVEDPKPPAAQPQPGEQTATNPNTGERMVLRGGKWVPL